MLYHPGMPKKFSEPQPRVFIGEWMDALGIEAKDLMESTGLSGGFISLLRNGHRNPSHGALFAIARAMKMPHGSPQYLFRPPPTTIQELREFPRELSARIIESISPSPSNK
jgi:transcriptional regulator with XRE-family HTH domain